MAIRLMAVQRGTQLQVRAELGSEDTVEIIQALFLDLTVQKRRQVLIR